MQEETKKRGTLRKGRGRGFSIIELIVAVAILLVISSIVLFKQSKFSSDVLITNLAYEIALSFRQAQAFGISSKQSSSATPTFRVGYGLHFSSSFTDGASYIEFVDNALGSIDPGEDATFDYVYTPAAGDLGEIVEIGRGQRIRSYCGVSGATETCWPDTDFDLNVVFVKPDTDAHIRSGTGTVYNEAKIEVISALGDKCRTIRVTSVGQISVDQIEADNLAGCSE